MNSFLSILNWKELPKKNFMVIRDCVSNDGNFLCNLLLNECLKGGKSAALVSFTNGFYHFHKTQMKMGVNLTKAGQSGKFRFFSGFGILEEKGDESLDSELVYESSLEYVKSKFGQTGKISAFKLKLLKKQEETKRLKMEKFVSSLSKDGFLKFLCKKGETKESFDMIILDDFTPVVLSMGDNKKEIVNLLNETKKQNSIVVTKVNRNNEWSKYLGYISDVVLEVDPLDHGFTKELTGKVSCWNKTRNKRMRAKYLETDFGIKFI